MSLSEAQLAALRTKCFADPTAAAFFGAPGNSAGLRAYLNSDSTFVVWKTFVTRDEIQGDDLFDWTLVDNLSTNSKYRIWEWMFNNALQAINPSKANIRAGINATWTGTQALVAVATNAIYPHCKRAANGVEKMLASGTGTTATPGQLTYEGAISEVESVQLIYKVDGTLWTA